MSGFGEACDFIPSLILPLDLGQGLQRRGHRDQQEIGRETTDSDSVGDMDMAAETARALGQKWQDSYCGQRGDLAGSEDQGALPCGV